MKKLELNQMLALEAGGITCGEGFGFGAALLIGGFMTAAIASASAVTVATGGVGLGAGIYMVGAASIWINGVFNEDC
ncbi:hypothetical protein [Polaribacter sp. R77954]|uniref:hypothetical protein n=1 Tax=Polaribacter sp. R77954 TaxID=3093870 RepID=UPI0037CBA6C8